MKITVRNLTSSILSTDVGAIAPGATKSMEMDPRQVYKASEGLKLLQDAGRCTVTVESEAGRLDAMEGGALPAASVDAAELAAGAVTTTKIADLAVTAGKLQDEAVTAAKLGTGAVTTTKIDFGAVTIDRLDEAVLRSADLTITSAELLALNAAPKTLVAAPGVAKAVVLEEVYMRLVPPGENPAAYAGIEAGDDLAVRYSNGTGDTVATVEATGFLNQITAQLRYCKASAAAAITPVENAPLVVHMTGSEVTTGNSDLVVRCLYRVISTAF